MLNTNDKSEQGFNRVIRRVIQNQATPRAEGCPDSDALAAYFERSLLPAEHAHWEAHFSNCARCQQQLALLGRMDLQAAQTASEAAWWNAFWPQNPLLRWTVPAAAVGAVALALMLWPERNAPDQTLIAQNTPVPGASSPQLGEPAKAPEPASAASGKPESSASPGHVSGTGKQAGTHRDLPALPSVPAPALPDQDAAKARLEEYRAKEQVALDAIQPLENQQSIRSTTLGKRETAEETRIRSEQADRRKAELETGDAKVNPATVPAPGAVSAPPSAPLPARGRADAPVAAAGLRKRDSNHMERLFSSPFIDVASPSGRVVWRFGATGQLIKSTDSGRTWLPLGSSVEVDLLAGAAPSETACWIVGQAGVVLRTTDGERWEKLAAPVAADLVRIKAQDGLRAVVTTRDGISYETADGGRSWKLTQEP